MCDQTPLHEHLVEIVSWSLRPLLKAQAAELGNMGVSVRFLPLIPCRVWDRLSVPPLTHLNNN